MNLAAFIFLFISSFLYADDSKQDSLKKLKMEVERLQVLHELCVQENEVYKKFIKDLEKKQKRHLNELILHHETYVKSLEQKHKEFIATLEKQIEVHEKYIEVLKKDKKSFVKDLQAEYERYIGDIKKGNSNLCAEYERYIGKLKEQRNAIALWCFNTILLLSVFLILYYRRYKRLQNLQDLM